MRTLIGITDVQSPLRYSTLDCQVRTLLYKLAIRIHTVCWVLKCLYPVKLKDPTQFPPVKPSASCAVLELLNPRTGYANDNPYHLFDINRSSRTVASHA